MTRIDRTCLVLAGVLIGGAVFAQGGAGGEEVWVLLQGSGEIAIIDAGTNTIDATRIDVADADGDTLLDPPNDLCFSSIPGAPGGTAFVTQGRFVTVVDVATRSKLFSKDIGSFVTTQIGELVGCVTAAPFEAAAVGGSVIENDLFVAGTSTSGDALWFAFDQDALASSAPLNPVRGHGTLATSATGGDVEALELDAGSTARRAIFTATRTAPTGDEVLAIRLSGSKTTPPTWFVESTRIFPLATGAAPARVRPGAPFGGELPGVPAGGELHNLDTGGFCALSGSFSAVELIGPGQDSYSVFALDTAAGEVHVVEPYECESNPIAVGAGPVAMATLGVTSWRSLFVAERDGDSVSRIDPDGTVTPFLLGTGGAACMVCPVAVAVPAVALCVPGKEQLWDRDDFDGDGQKDDLRIEFDVDGCPQSGPFTVWCRARDLDAHPDCFCDCTVMPPDEDCDCPELLPDLGFAGAGGGLAFAKDDDDIIKDTPWKKLGISKDGSFVHEDGADFGDTQYDVSMDDSPPGS